MISFFLETQASFCDFFLPPSLIFYFFGGGRVGGGGGKAQEAEWSELRPVAEFVSQSSLIQAKCVCTIKKTFNFTLFFVGYLLSVLSIRQGTVVGTLSKSHDEI